MAKSMKTAARLRAVSGSVDAAPGAQSEAVVCYNLVVDEFHTYFVGQTRLLAHDRTCPAPNPASLPGSVQPRTPSPADGEFADMLADAQRGR